jgi:iron complex transport system ATP-binding protein
VISVKDYQKSFNNKILFTNLNFDIPENKLTIILGLNGSGKTTLLKELANPSSPQIKNNYKKTFFLPQKFSYPKEITLFEYLITPYYSNALKWYITKEEEDFVTKILKELNLEQKRDIQISRLSSGELQIANIALSIISGADCLLLDEPVANLDIINQIKILDFLKRLTEINKTCIITIHDLSLAARYGDYFIGLSLKENIIGAKDIFFEENNLNKIFGIKFKVEREDEEYIIQTNL